MTEQETAIALDEKIEPETEISSQPSQTPKKRVRGDAMTRLSKAIFTNVRDNSDELAEALCKRALSGDVSSLKLLVALLEKNTDEPKKKFRSMALEIANAPEWTEPPLPDVNNDGETMDEEEMESLLKEYRP